jgi:hypothetical protein
MNLSEDIFVCLTVLLDRLRLCYSRQSSNWERKYLNSSPWPRLCVSNLAQSLFFPSSSTERNQEKLTHLPRAHGRVSHLVRCPRIDRG